MNDGRGSAKPEWTAAFWVLMMLVAASPAGAETLRGTVLNKVGEPVGRAIIWAAELYAGGPLAARETQADASGRFALEVKPGKWYVWARDDTWSGEIDQHAIPTVLPGHDAGPVTIRLRERGWLRGRLIEFETGRPIAGGRFIFDNAVELKANRLGRFDFAGISPHFHEAYVVAPGRERRRILFDMTLRTVAELELRIPRAGRIVGRVTDERGKPIPGAYVGYSTSGNTFSGTANWDRCDPDGRYAWDGKVFDRPTRLAAGAPGYLGEQKDNLIVSAGAAPLELNFRLKPAPASDGQRTGGPSPQAESRRDVTGTVTLPGGRPAANAIVRWGAVKHSRSVQTQTDGEGRFRLAGAPDENGVLAVIAPGSTGTAPAFPSFARGGNRDIAVTLEPGETAKGRVLDDGGAPLEGVSVVPTVPSHDRRFGRSAWLLERSATTDAQGRFSLEGLPESAVQFEFHGDGLIALHNQPLNLDGADNQVVMHSGGMIRGRVVDRDGKPVRNFRILVNAPHERQPGDKFGGYFAGYCGIGITFTSDDGVFVITELEADRLHRISAVADGYAEGVSDRVTSTTLTHLSPAEALTIRLGPPHHLKVRAVRSGDEAHGIPAARVTLVNGDPDLDRQFSWGYHDASWEDMTRGRTDQAGWADFPVLACGEATVLVQAPGLGRRRLGWRDGRGELVVTLDTEAVLTGEVRDAAGVPLKDAYVGLVGASGDSMTAPVDGRQQGRFRLAELPEGEYTFTIRRSFGSEVYEQRITLRPGQVLDKKIRLAKDADEKGIRKGAGAFAR